MCGVRLLCSAHCKYNDGTGYYNLCNHKDVQKVTIPYGGVDRIYTEGCSLGRDAQLNNAQCNKDQAT